MVSKEYFFPEVSDVIFMGFIKMLLFDAYVGNSDRHFYNWGVVKHLKGKHKPYLSPIYDTARGLWWNKPESKIVDMYKNLKAYKTAIDSYLYKSKPKIGWETVNNQAKLNHFDLIKLIIQEGRFINDAAIFNIFNDESLAQCIHLIDKEFSELMSEERRFIIKHCLKQRHNLFIDKISQCSIN